jgi:hypothetical protein
VDGLPFQYSEQSPRMLTNPIYRVSKTALEQKLIRHSFTKSHGAPTMDESRYSLATCVECAMKTVTGDPGSIASTQSGLQGLSKNFSQPVEIN